MLEAQAGYCRWVEHWLYNLRQFLFQKYQFSETEFTRRTDILNFSRDFPSCFAPIGDFKVIINTWAILAFRAVVKKWCNSFVLISLPLSDRNFWKASLCWMASSRLYFIGSKWPVEACIFQIKWDMARGKLTETLWVLRIRYARKTSVTVPVHCCTSYTTAPRTLLVSRLLCLCTSHSNYIAEASGGSTPQTLEPLAPSCPALLSAVCSWLQWLSNIFHPRKLASKDPTVSIFYG